MHHLNADVDRLYVKREEGGRGLLLIEVTCKEDIINMQNILKQNILKTSL
jgi:hypothetical protein